MPSGWSSNFSSSESVGLMPSVIYRKAIEISCSLFFFYKIKFNSKNMQWINGMTLTTADMAKLLNRKPLRLYRLPSNIIKSPSWLTSPPSDLNSMMFCVITSYVLYTRNYPTDTLHFLLPNIFSVKQSLCWSLKLFSLCKPVFLWEWQANKVGFRSENLFYFEKN